MTGLIMDGMAKIKRRNSSHTWTRSRRNRRRRKGREKDTAAHSVTASQKKSEGKDRYLSGFWLWSWANTNRLVRDFVSLLILSQLVSTKNDRRLKHSCIDLITRMPEKWAIAANISWLSFLLSPPSFYILLVLKIFSIGLNEQKQ